MRRQVLGTSNGEIVDDDDLMAIAKKTIDQVASDEAGAAGDDAFHVCTIGKFRRISLSESTAKLERAT